MSTMTLTAPPSIGADLKLTPQARTVLRHLQTNNGISPMEALVVYSIPRLAACIYEIRRKAGYVVDCVVRKDDAGHKYARYSLAATVH